jgi:hypothetical protein
MPENRQMPGNKEWATFYHCVLIPQCRYLYLSAIHIFWWQINHQWVFPDRIDYFYDERTKSLEKALTHFQLSL